MSMEELLSTAINQAPILTIVMAFLYFNNRTWQKYLTDRNSKMEKSLDRMTDEFKKSNDRMFSHMEKHEK